MLGVTILAVGRLKEEYLRAACAEYLKRLGAYSKMSVVEIDEERLTKGRSEEAVKQAEGERLLAKVPPQSLVVALEREGRMQSSEELAQMLDRLMCGGTGHVTFIIGGSLGLSSDVIRRADVLLSFSKLTFPHQLMRVMLLEQLYRAMNSLRGGKYHK